MNPKQFLRSLSWLVVLNLLVKPLWMFGVDRKVQNEVGHEAYGTYFSILNLAIILAILADAGLTNLGNRELAIGGRIAVRPLLRLKGALSVLYLLVLCAVCWSTGVDRWDLVLLTGALQVTVSFFVFFRNLVTGYQLYKTDAWLSVADKSTTILVCGVLLYGPFAGHLSLRTFLLIQLAATGGAALLAARIAARQHEGPAGSVHFAELLRGSAPFVLLILLMGIHTRLDAFLLERLRADGPAQAGIYAAAYRLLDAGNTVGYMTASFLVPFAARHRADGALVDATVLRLRHGLFAAAALFTGVCAGAAPFLMHLLYAKLEGPLPAQALVLCAAVLPAYYGIHVYGSLLTAAGRLARFSRVMAACVLLNVALNALWIGPYGVLGCGAAALVSQYVCAVALFIGARGAFRLQVHAASLPAYAAIGLAAFAGARWWQGVPAAWAFLACGAAIGATLIMFAVRERRPKRIPS